MDWKVVKKKKGLDALSWKRQAELRRRLQPDLELRRKHIFNMQINTPLEYTEYCEEEMEVTIGQPCHVFYFELSPTPSPAIFPGRTPRVLMFRRMANRDCCII